MNVSDGLRGQIEAKKTLKRFAKKIFLVFFWPRRPSKKFWEKNFPREIFFLTFLGVFCSKWAEMGVACVFSTKKWDEDFFLSEEIFS